MGNNPQKLNFKREPLPRHERIGTNQVQRHKIMEGIAKASHNMQPGRLSNNRFDVWKRELNR